MNKLPQATSTRTATTRPLVLVTVGNAAAPRHNPKQNHLLAALPPADFDRLAPHLALVELQLGEVVYQTGGQLQHAYFPTSAIISLQYISESGALAEIAGVGNEGVIGVPLFMGGDSLPTSAVVQTAGFAYRVERRFLQAQFECGGDMQRLLLRYTQARMTQMTHTVVCNLHHAVEQQLCRFLLMTLDRIPSGELVMTHEIAAVMLGVRRERVTQAAGRLRDAGCISYSRGHISVLDRAGLESRACECYAAVRKELDRLLHDVRPRLDRPAMAPAWLAIKEAT